MTQDESHHGTEEEFESESVEPDDVIVDVDLEGDSLSEEVEAPNCEEHEKLVRERDEYLALAQRLQADFDNYRKRVSRQQAEISAQGTRELVVKLLPALDTLNLAVAHATDEGTEDVSALAQVLAGFTEALTREGLEVVEPLGKKFDPEESEAVAHDEGEGEPVVAEVFRVGYRWRGQTIRPAMVRVAGS